MNQLTKSQENYIKIIYELSLHEGAVHISDIAANLEVSKASASVAAKSLEEKGLVWRDAGRLVYLTHKGQKQAMSVLDKFWIINDFLINELQVDSNTAYLDAHALEHVVSEETICALRRFLDEQKSPDANGMLRAE